MASALREMHDYETAIPIIRTCLGLRPGMLMDDETRRRMNDRLADLIEPSCDREALLELANQLSGDVEPYQWEVGEQSYFKSIIARRIREACGVVA